MIDLFTTKDIVYALAILIMAGWTAYKEIREMRLTKKWNLSDNPKRCQEHGEAIARLEVRAGVIEDDVKEMRDILRGK